MKIKIMLFFLLLLGFAVKAQTSWSNDSLKGFNHEEMQHHLSMFKGTEKEKAAYVERVKRRYIARKYGFDTPTPPPITNERMGGSSVQQSCTNIDFESGNTSGWTVSGSNYITSGAGTDPFGNFPVVYPGSGNYSLQLSDNNLSTSNFTSSASRVISVTPGNTFFNLHFAMDILDYPHDSASAASLSIQFFNSAGVALTCPNYQCLFYVDAFNNPHAVGISNFQQTWGCGGSTCFPTTGPGVNLGSQNYPVTYADWQTVALDLTPYVGTNITCQVTCKWCIYNYDWAYCYIDADCPTSNTTPLGTCLTLPASLCGPPGMGSYSWVAPAGNSVATANTTCINATTAGVFSLTCTSITNCSSTTYTYAYTVGPGPTASFTNTTASCAGIVNFNSTSTSSGSSITSYTWDWGDGTPNGSNSSASHSFAGTGTQTVTLYVTNGSCIDTASATVNIPPHPIVNFNLANNCLSAPSTFTSTSSSVSGISSQTWDFGDGSAGTSGTTPTHTYGSAGTYTVTLIVTDNSPCTDSLKMPITIYPQPTITVNAPSACNGGTATLNAGGASTYTWSPSTGLSTTIGASVNSSPPATQTYVVTGTDANGCVNTNTTTVTVAANPAVIINSPTICVGSTATLTATGATTYVWSPSTGLSSPVGTTVTTSPANTTTYSVLGSVGTCTASGTCTVTVNPLPLVTVNNGTICVSQQTATLTAGGADTYVWSPSTGLSSTIGTSVTATPALTSTYIVIGTDINGCVNTATTTVKVNPLPVVTVKGDTTCVNTTINLTASGGVGYLWSGPLGYTSSVQNPGITGALTTMSGTYSVVVTDGNGCYNSNATQVLVNPLPVVAAGANSPCVAGVLNLTSSSAVSWTWNGPNGFVSHVQNPSIAGANAASAGIYSVSATDANGCVGIGTVPVTVNPLPVVAILPAMSSGCEPLCVNFSTTDSLGGNAYNWAFGDGNTSTSSTPNHCFTGQGTLSPSLTVTDVNGCVSNVVASVIIFPVPHADFNADPQPTTITDALIHFSDATSLAHITGWYWTITSSDSVTHSTSVNPSLLYTEPGTYPVHMVVTSDHGCKDSITKDIVIQPDYLIYVPNAFSPNADGINDYFFAKGEGIQDFKMRIYDRWGSLIFVSDNMAKGWDGTVHGYVVQEDVYVWKIELKTVRGESKSLRGVVSVVK